MFKLIGNALSQWDIDRILEITPSSGAVDSVVIKKGIAELTVPVFEDGSKYRVEIPNIFLQNPGVITVCVTTIVDGHYRKKSVKYTVRKKDKPKDYSYEETDVLELGSLIRTIDEKYIPDTIARTADVVSSPTAAAVGQTIVVKAVDDAGKPTEWEAVDLPSAAGENFVVEFDLLFDDEGEEVLGVTASKTHAEIYAAYQEGKNIVGKEYYGCILQLTFIYSSRADFVGYTSVNNGQVVSNIGYAVSIESSGKVHYTKYDLQDGSMSIDVESE